MFELPAREAVGLALMALGAVLAGWLWRSEWERGRGRG